MRRGFLARRFLLGELLAGAPGVRLLVTTQEPLHLHGEWLVPLAGLPYRPLQYRVPPPTVGASVLGVGFRHAVVGHAYYAAHGRLV
mgnify:CR=1 FL=1